MVANMLNCKLDKIDSNASNLDKVQCPWYTLVGHKNFTIFFTNFLCFFLVKVFIYTFWEINFFVYAALLKLKLLSHL